MSGGGGREEAGATGEDWYSLNVYLPHYPSHGISVAACG